MGSQQWNVLASFPQRRDSQAENVEPEVKIAAKTALRHCLLQVAIGSGQNAYIDGNSLGAAHRADLAFLNGAQQLRLQIDRQLANLIQKHCSAFCNRQQAITRLHRPGKRAFHVPKQLAFNKRRNQRATVHRDEGLGVKWPREMNCPRHHFLTGSALSQDQHRMIAVRRLGDDAIKLLHLRRAAHDASESLFRLDLLPQQTIFALKLHMD